MACSLIPHATTVSLVVAQRCNNCEMGKLLEAECCYIQ